MTRDDDKPENTIQRSRRFDAAPGSTMRREPGFSNLEDLDEDGYEEPDRDTNFASGYRADSVEDEEEYDDEFSDDDENEAFAAEMSDPGYEPGQILEEDSDVWIEEESYLDEHENERQSWPLGLIVVGIVAVVLLAAGAYGVLQQRAATQAELRDLRAALAVAASPDAVGANRSALETLQQAHDKLAAEAQALSLENRRLADTVAGLEAQLGAQQSVPAQPLPVAKTNLDADADKPVAGNTIATQSTEASSSPAATQSQAPTVAQSPTSRSTPEPAGTSAAPPTSTTNTAGAWFVNFGTYATRNMADTWASRVRPLSGKVIVAPNDKDGRTLYRVRVVGLADREAAQQVARQLEADLRVSQLWVGRE